MLIYLIPLIITCCLGSILFLFINRALADQPEIELIDESSETLDIAAEVPSSVDEAEPFTLAIHFVVERASEFLDSQDMKMLRAVSRDCSRHVAFDIPADEFLRRCQQKDWPDKDSITRAVVHISNQMITPFIESESALECIAQAAGVVMMKKDRGAAIVPDSQPILDRAKVIWRMAVDLDDDIQKIYKFADKTRVMVLHSFTEGIVSNVQRWNEMGIRIYTKGNATLIFLSKPPEHFQRLDLHISGMLDKHLDAMNGWRQGLHKMPLLRSASFAYSDDIQTDLNDFGVLSHESTTDLLRSLDIAIRHDGVEPFTLSSRAVEKFRNIDTVTIRTLGLGTVNLQFLNGLPNLKKLIVRLGGSTPVIYPDLRNIELVHHDRRMRVFLDEVVNARKVTIGDRMRDTPLGMRMTNCKLVSILYLDDEVIAQYHDALPDSLEILEVHNTDRRTLREIDRMNQTRFRGALSIRLYK